VARRIRSVFWLGALSLFLTPAGSALAQNTCAGEKIKAAGKKATCKTGLEAKQASKGGTIDPAKVAKCEAKLSSTFAKNEGNGGCLTTGNAAAVEAKIDAFVADLDTELAVGTLPNKCQGEKVKAAGKKAACKLNLEAKQASKGGTIDPAKVAKCEAKLSSAFAKQEAGGACHTTGDTAAIEAKVDAFVADVDVELSGPSVTTTTIVTTTTTTTTLPPSCSGDLYPSCYVGDGACSLPQTCYNADLDDCACCVVALGNCWWLGAAGESCDQACASVGRQYSATTVAAGSFGSLANCVEVLDALQVVRPNGDGDAPVDCSVGLGCFFGLGSGIRCAAPATTGAASVAGAQRVCSCGATIPTTTSTTTTTTLPSCGGATYPACGGSCPSGSSCYAVTIEDTGGCQCHPTGVPCEGCGGAACPPGQACVPDDPFEPTVCSCGAP
jgi:hypothetical protein